MNQENIDNEVNEQREDLGLIERLVSIVINPKKVFRSVEKDPKILVPILIIIGLMVAIGAILYIPYKDAMIKALMQQYESLNVPVGNDTINAVAIATILGTILFSPIVTIVTSLLYALYYFICSMIFKGNAKYKQILSVVLHANIISILASVVGYIVVALTKNPMMSSVTSAINFLPNDQTLSFLGGFLQKFEIFNIWSQVLIVLGLTQVNKLDRKINIVLVVIGFIATAAIIGLVVHMNAIMMNAMSMS